MTRKRPSAFHIGEKPRYTVRAVSDSAPYLWRLEWYVARRDESDRTSKLQTAPLGRHASKSEAQAAAIALIQSGKAGPSIVKLAPGQLKTLTILLSAYKADLLADPQRPRSTQLAYSSHIDRLVGRIGDIPCNPVPSYDLLNRYVRGVIADGYHPNTARQDLVILSAAWAWGRDRERVPREKLPKVLVEVPAQKPYTPPAEDVRRVLGRLMTWRETGDAPEWAPLAARLLWGTGARRTEIALLTRRDVRLMLDADDAPYALIELGTHAGGRKTGNRYFPIGDRETAEALALWMDAHPGGDTDGLWGRAPRTVEDVSEWIGKACDAEKVPRFTAQPIRRAVTDALYEAGADPKVEAELLGHTENTAMKYYRKARESTKASAVLKAGLGMVAEPKEADVLDIRTGKPKR